MEERAPVPDRYSEIIPAERASTYLRALRRRWWLVLATTAVAAWTGFLVSSLQQKQYDATAKVLLMNTEPVNVLLHSTIAPSQDPERDLNTQTALVKLDSIARRVRAQLSLPLTSSQVLGKVSAQPDGTSNLIAITASDSRPARASAIANAFAREYVDLRRHEAQAAYRTAAGQAQLQLARLSPGEQAGAQGIALRRQLRQLEIAGSLQTGGAQLVDDAAVPTNAASPRPKLAAVVGAFVGFLIGALAAIAAGQMPLSALKRKADDGRAAFPSSNGFAAATDELIAEHVHTAEKPRRASKHEGPHPVQLSRDDES